ncbi:459eaccf-15c7-4ae4-b8c8-ab7d402ee8a8 [Sclerotinia trifoliorum]|uniref:459eaccf-15c7-4ae4-b8c8-ab7d402ee8a8 n=1 Tax=Sclerotinia trifoliorum TaxID=28548 RepID=A0A8H2ZQG1_9HELO|nr:459eaccf-15c7-4ae4-b8c8-ab7d402ee8a8 [Sclerotinia trifoliorum]
MSTCQHFIDNRITKIVTTPGFSSPALRFNMPLNLLVSFDLRTTAQIPTVSFSAGRMCQESEKYAVEVKEGYADSGDGNWVDLEYSECRRRIVSRSAWNTTGWNTRRHESLFIDWR